MNTIKQISDLTGISVRMLHYYDKIGLLKPSAVTEANYRLYDDEALETLQQILFLKELDVPLKSMKEIMDSPRHDKLQALREQKELLMLKRDRLNELIDLIEGKMKAGDHMSFKEFDMSEYFDALKTFKQEHADQVIQYYGSVEEFEKNFEGMKSKELEIANMAIKEFGSIEKYTDAMKNNLEHLPEIMDNYQTIQANAEFYIAQLNQLTEHLVSDLSKSPASVEIQAIVKEMDDMVKEQYKILGVTMGENHWGMMADLYLTKPEYIKINDKKYGKGTSKFLGEALKFYNENKK
ncbi:MAG: putative transcriptional regulator [Herbinix sp.]|jgi:DNA-binding transcriptional MerR regulator|nr:putative transcriptional regulator [Herbinix sp.]